MAKVAVVFHSGYGHTLRMAQSVAEGAGAELVSIDAEGNVTDAGWETFNAADAIIMGSPTYMGIAYPITARPCLALHRPYRCPASPRPTNLASRLFAVWHHPF